MTRPCSDARRTLQSLSGAGESLRLAPRSENGCATRSIEFKFFILYLPRREVRQFFGGMAELVDADNS